MIQTIGESGYKSLSGPDVFIGVSKEFTDETTARDDADFHARKQIIESLGMKLTTEIIDRYLVNGETGEIITGEFWQDRKTKAVATSMIRVKSTGYYIEKWARCTPSGIEYYHRVWSLFKYSQADHNQMISEVVNLLLRFVEPALQAGENLRNQGRIYEAMRQLRRVRALSKELESYQGGAPDLTAKLREQFIRAEELMAGISILVAVRESIDGDVLQNAVVEAKLAEILSADGSFTIKSSMNWSSINSKELMENRELQKQIAGRESVDLLLIGEASVDGYTEMARNYFIAQNKMQLKLVEGSTGTVLWETTVPGNLIPERKSRGYADNPQIAAQRALYLTGQRDDLPLEPFKKICESILSALK